jgi:hypothetical protein
MLLIISNPILCGMQTLSINTDTHKETEMFKKVLKSIWDFFSAIGEARYAAELARNGKYREAQEYCQKK